MTLARFLHARPNRPAHPVIRRWEFKKGSAGVQDLECEIRRERNGLSFEPAELHVFFLGSDGKDAAEPDSAPWDAELDDWLLANRVRSTSPSKEAERFGFGLAGRLLKAEERFGDGFFNAVLRSYLRSSDLGKLMPIATLLKDVHENTPQRSEASADCEQMIEAAISSVGQDLTTRLEYDDDAATTVLAEALAYYLDERFNVSNRRMLGFLR